MKNKNKNVNMQTVFTEVGVDPTTCFRKEAESVLKL
jgi:hypothetical protein